MDYNITFNKHLILLVDYLHKWINKEEEIIQLGALKMVYLDYKEKPLWQLRI